VGKNFTFGWPKPLKAAAKKEAPKEGVCQENTDKDDPSLESWMG
jgi:hypothetical protein